MKAAFLYNFAKFVEWPAFAFKSPAEPVSICIAGTNPFGDSLAQVVDGKTIDNRPIRLRELGDSPAASGCHILFVADSVKKRCSALLDGVRGAGVLTIGDSPGFAAQGGVINFKVDGGHVKFQINPRAAEGQKISVSSKLLKLAEII